MVIALISVAFVCLMAAGLCLGAALRFMSRSDALQRAHAEVSGASTRALEAVALVQQQISALNTTHWESASSRISALTGRTADLESIAESLKESQRNFENKMNAREKRAQKVEPREVDDVIPELPKEDMTQEQLWSWLRENGQAMPMAPQQAPAADNGRSHFGQKASAL